MDFKFKSSSRILHFLKFKSSSKILHFLKLFNNLAYLLSSCWCVCLVNIFFCITNSPYAFVNYLFFSSFFKSRKASGESSFGTYA
jgi:hypothetical protein